MLVTGEGLTLMLMANPSTGTRPLLIAAIAECEAIVLVRLPKKLKAKSLSDRQVSLHTAKRLRTLYGWESLDRAIVKGMKTKVDLPFDGLF
jgi:hypothetical protein